MPRTLPWLQQAAGSSAKKTPIERPVKHQRNETPEIDSDLNTTGVSTPERRARLKPLRSPSTSPPPQAPDVDYMREGYAADDIWRMVEDEFLSTAKLYTQHLHHAEYVRLKRLARSRGDAALQAIARPTDGRTAQSLGAKRQHEADAHTRKIKHGLSRIAGQLDSDDEDDEPWMFDAQLAGLMGNGRPSGEVLTGVAKAKSNTRAAAGFVQDVKRHAKNGRSAVTAAKWGPAQDVGISNSPSPPRPLDRINETDETDETADDDDDLDIKPTKPVARTILSSVRKADIKTSELRRKDPNIGVSKDLKPIKYQEASNEKGKMRTDNHQGPLNVFKAVVEDSAAARRAREDAVTKRKVARQKKEREEKRKAIKEEDVDDIPTFLF